jgi:hypothetical protein
MNEATHKVESEYFLRQNLAEYLAIAHPRFHKGH